MPAGPARRVDERAAGSALGLPPGPPGVDGLHGPLRRPLRAGRLVRLLEELRERRAPAHRLQRVVGLRRSQVLLGRVQHAPLPGQPLVRRAQAQGLHRAGEVPDQVPGRDGQLHTQRERAPAHGLQQPPGHALPNPPRQQRVHPVGEASGVLPGSAAKGQPDAVALRGGQEAARALFHARGRPGRDPHGAPAGLLPEPRRRQRVQRVLARGPGLRAARRGWPRVHPALARRLRMDRVVCMVRLLKQVRARHTHAEAAAESEGRMGLARPLRIQLASMYKPHTGYILQHGSVLWTRCRRRGQHKPCCRRRRQPGHIRGSHHTRARSLNNDRRELPVFRVPGGQLRDAGKHHRHHQRVHGRHAVTAISAEWKCLGSLGYSTGARQLPHVGHLCDRHIDAVEKKILHRQQRPPPPKLNACTLLPPLGRAANQMLLHAGARGGRRQLRGEIDRVDRLLPRRNSQRADRPGGAPGAARHGRADDPRHGVGRGAVRGGGAVREAVRG
mmetsp:Transcript_120371/g.341046  ORF Transcript_120371/g.341046 Transcript_120371/m.341046 type:complete len:501 (+) Transcript_120371:331-1833(+)